MIHSRSHMSICLMNKTSTKLKVEVLVTQSCPTLYDPMDCSLPGFSVRRILQARIREWIAIPFSRGSSPPRDRTQVSCMADSLPSEPWRKSIGAKLGVLLLLFLYKIRKHFLIKFQTVFDKCMKNIFNYHP